MSSEIPQKRVITIDILRGISIFLMLMAHIETYWLEPESFWVIGIKFLIAQIMGTSNFTFVAGIGFAFSFQKSIKKSTSRNLAIKKSLSHTIILIIFSFIFNGLQVLIGGLGLSGLWVWNILQCIAFCRLFGILIILVSKYYRFVIAIILVFLTEFIISWMLPRYEVEPLARSIFIVFFNPLHGDGILIFIPFFIFGTLIGEFIHYITNQDKASLNNEDASKKISNSIKKWFLIGLGMLILGLIIGLKPVGAERDYYELLKWISTHPNIDISSLPSFIMPNFYAWVFFCAGWQIMFALLSFYIIDIKGHFPKSSNIFSIFGKYSLSISDSSSCPCRPLPSRSSVSLENPEMSTKSMAASRGAKPLPASSASSAVRNRNGVYAPRRSCRDRFFSISPTSTQLRDKPAYTFPDILSVPKHGTCVNNAQ